MSECEKKVFERYTYDCRVKGLRVEADISLVNEEFDYATLEVNDVVCHHVIEPEADRTDVNAEVNHVLDYIEKLLKEAESCKVHSKLTIEYECEP